MLGKLCTTVQTTGYILYPDTMYFKIPHFSDREFRLLHLHM